MIGTRNRGTSDQGMTLPEVMIAASILLVCLVSLAGLLGSSISSNLATRARDEATNLANERIESARSMPYDSVGLVNGEPAGSIVSPQQVGRFTVTTECDWVQVAAGRAGYKRLKITVAWAVPFPAQIEANTIVYGKTGLSGTGDILVHVSYRETPSPVTGSEVTVVAANGTVRRALTNSSGEVLFGQVPVGLCTLSVTPPAGYIVDSSTLTGAAVSTDSASTAMVYVQLPAQATVQVTDLSGVAIANAVTTIRRSDGAVTASAVTDSAGIATFSQLLYGGYSATASREYFTSATLPFTVSQAAPNPAVVFRLDAYQWHGLRTRVFDSNGTQLPGATVVVTNGGVETTRGVSGSNGEIAFGDLAVATYIVTVSKAGYSGLSQSATIHWEHDEETLTFALSAQAADGNMHIMTYKNNKAWNYRLEITGPNGYFTDSLYTGGSSNPNGELSLSDLVPGEYYVRIYGSSGSPVTARVYSNQTTEVSL